MKRFQFRFTTLETIRKATEKLVLSELARAQRALVAENDRKVQLEVDLKNALEMRQDLRSVAEFQLWDARIIGLKQAILRAEGAIRRAKKLAERCSERYMLARRNVKAIETLKDQDRLAFKKAKDKYEQKQFDDSVIMRSRLNNGEVS